MFICQYGTGEMLPMFFFSFFSFSQDGRGGTEGYLQAW